MPGDVRISGRAGLGLFVVVLIAGSAGWMALRGRTPPLRQGACTGCNVLLVTIDTLRSDRVGAFGGASGLLWLTQFTPGSKRSAEPAELERSYAWITAGCIASLIFVAILGPSIHF